MLHATIRALRWVKRRLVIPIGRAVGIPSRLLGRLTRPPAALQPLVRRSIATGQAASSATETAAQARRLVETASRLQKKGALTEASSTLTVLLRLTGSDSTLSQLRALNGMRREMDPSWMPAIPGPARPLASPDCWRICHLHKVAYPFENSGASVRNLNIVAAQKAAGLDPFVVLPLGYPPGQPRATGWLRTTAGVDYYAVSPSGWNSKRLTRDQQMQLDVLAAARLLTELRPLLIHAASGYRGYDLALKGLALGRHFDIPVVYEVRSLHEHTWSPAGPDVLEAEHTALRMAQEHRCMREADHVVTISESMKALLVTRGVEPSRITVVPNGIATDKYLHRGASRAGAVRERIGFHRHPVVGMVSNMSWREGHSLLLAALKRLEPALPNLRCLFVGDGPLRRALEDEAEHLGVRHRVHFAGEIDHSEVDDYYEAIDVFVVPRRPDYAADHVTPLKPYEAMALHRPLVVADRPALLEIIGKQERGLSFRTDDVDHLAARIREMLANDELRTKLAAAAHAWVTTERSWQSLVRRYWTVYQTILPPDVLGALPHPDLATTPDTV
jgi:glycosyltransferase involved in cell wall biosynthesis